MLSFFLAAQLAVTAQSIDSTYSTAALRAMVGRAAESNRSVPNELRSYTSHIETEMSLLLRDTLGRQQTASVEQFATAAAWERGGRYDLHIVGYRSQSVGVPYSTLTIVRGWTVPSLYGDRLSMGAYFTNTRRGDTLIAVHPFAADRDKFYRFTGGDTVATLHAGDRRIPLARIHVRPMIDGTTRLGAFEGDIDIDAQRFQIVRMRGRFVVAASAPSKRSLLGRVLGVTAVAYAEFVNVEIDGKYWLPAFQRTEFQAGFALLGPTRPVFRLVSTVSGIAVNETAAGSADSVGHTRVIVSWAPSDSLGAYGSWAREIGAQTMGVHADDFLDMAPDAWRLDGPPRLTLFPTTSSRLAHFNRVEGLFTGIAPTIDFRSAVPGLRAGAWGGVAWSEHTARGGGFTSYRAGANTLNLRAERALESTNDFTLPFDEDPGFAAFLSSIDNYDYIDRRSATLGVTHIFGSIDDGLFTAQLGMAHDEPERARLTHGLTSATHFLANRGATAGTYARAIADLEIHPNVNGDFVAPGFGAHAHYEVASGDLDWQRAELRLSARKYFGPVTVSAHADGGIVFGDSPPPQTLFELGGNEALPGYDYKQFAGDRAALFRVFSSYRFPIWKRPIHLTRNIFLPSLSPGLAVSTQGGWSELSSPGAIAAARQLVAGSPVIAGLPVVADPTHGIRATVGAGITLFSDLIHLGVARPVDHAARWRFVGGFGSEF